MIVFLLIVWLLVIGFLVVLICTVHFVGLVVKMGLVVGLKKDLALDWLVICYYCYVICFFYGIQPLKFVVFSCFLSMCLLMVYGLVLFCYRWHLYVERKYIIRLLVSIFSMKQVESHFFYYTINSILIVYFLRVQVIK